MHFKSALMQCLRVNLLEREWWIDLPELTSIQLGKDAFCFEHFCKASELIMRSEHTNVNWGLDLPKLTSLTTEGRESKAFHNPRSITLEGMSYHSILTNRHALSHHCHSYQEMCFQPQGNPSYEESLSLLSFIPRHYSPSPDFSWIPSFFHTVFLFVVPFSSNTPLLLSGDNTLDLAIIQVYPFFDHNGHSLP